MPRQQTFDAVLTMLPGELDPKLALAATAELRGAYDEAARYYETVWRTNHSFYSAAFGLARLRARAGDRAGAIATLDQITAASAHFTAAGTAAIEILLDGRTADNVDEPTLLDAGKRASTLTLESATKRATIRLKVLGAALDWLEGGKYAEGCPALRCRLRPDRHPHRDGAVATARWRTRRPTCGSASLWWRRQMRSGRGPGYERRGGDVHAMRCDGRKPADRFCESCGTVLSGVRRVAIPGPGAVAGSSVRRLRRRDVRRRLLHRVRQPARRARTRPGGARRDRARSPTAVSNTRATRTPPQRESSPADRAKRSPSPCAMGCRLHQPPTRRRRAPRRPESTRCSMRLPLNGSRSRPCWQA